MKLSAILEDNIACVDQACSLLALLDTQAYTHRHPLCFNASVGGHIRHNLDHYANFFRGLPLGRIDYESRERDPSVETDLAAAHTALQSVATRLAKLSPTDLEAGCSVRVNTDSDDDSDPEQWSGSTIRRELQFLLGHAIHHHAQVAAMARSLGIEPPAGFGMAPSTIRHQARQKAAAAEKAACAQ